MKPTWKKIADSHLPALHLVRKTAEQAPAVFVSPELKPFAVTLIFDGQTHVINVLAFKSCDATISAIEMFFDGDDEMPESGMEIEVLPMNILPRAA